MVFQLNIRIPRGILPSTACRVCRIVDSINMQAGVCGDSKDAECRDQEPSSAIGRQVSADSWFFEGTVEFSIAQYQLLSPTRRTTDCNVQTSILSERHTES